MLLGGHGIFLILCKIYNYTFDYLQREIKRNGKILENIFQEKSSDVCAYPGMTTTEQREHFLNPVTNLWY